MKKNLKKIKETIKIDKYFDLLPNISVQHGWKMDYGYYKDHHGGLQEFSPIKSVMIKKLYFHKML